MRFDLKTRLAALHVLASAVILVIAAAGAHWSLRRAVLGQVIDRALLALAEAESSALASDPSPTAHVHERGPAASAPSFDRLDKFVQIAELDGAVLARSTTLGTSMLPIPAAMLDAARRGEIVFQTRKDFGSEPIRIVAIPVDRGDRRLVVQVAMSLDDADTVLQTARWLFGAMSIAILVAIGVTATILTRKAFEPVERVVSHARRIGESNLTERLPHPGLDDEIGRLVDTLNEMLARIESSFEAQRRFTSDASHELRSPLSRLRAELEVTLRRPRDREEYEETIRSGLEEVELLSRLTDELLTLARLDAERRPVQTPAPVRFGDVLDAVVRRLAAQATERGIVLDVPPSTSLDGTVAIEPAAVGLVLANLVDNAIKFSPPTTAVMVRAEQVDGSLIVDVSDGGPGIPPEDMPRIFERFFRGAAARATGRTGAGLGLAICRETVERYGGHITVESRDGQGSTFRVRLPLAGSASG